MKNAEYFFTVEDRKIKVVGPADAHENTFVSMAANFYLSEIPESGLPYGDFTIYHMKDEVDGDSDTKVEETISKSPKK